MKLRRILKILGLIVVVVTLATPVFATPNFTIYLSQSDWIANVGNGYELEDFSDSELNEGLSVVTDNGYVTAGHWWDRVINGQAATTWIFAEPIKAFGADFNLAGPGGPGQSIEIYVNGSWTHVGTIPETTNGFWGFESDVSFTAVRLEGGSMPGWCETYVMDNLVYKYAPKPATIDIRQIKINLKAKGVLRVAIFGSDTIDVTEIDTATIQIGDVGLVMRDGFLMVDYEDINEDGIMDLVCHFSIPELVSAGELTTTTTELTVIGEVGNYEFVGTDSIAIVLSGK